MLVLGLVLGPAFCGPEMAAHPAGSIPQQTRRWGDTKAAYRLFKRDEVTFEALTQPHWQRTRQIASQRPVVLHIQDGSQLDYTKHACLSDVGVIGDGGGRGLMLHSVLAVEALGMPPDQSRWIHVGDGEADNYDFFDACRRMGGGFLVRAYQNRRAAMGHEAAEPSGYLMDLARSLPPMGQKSLYVRRSKQREPGWVDLQVAAGPVTIFAPWLSCGGKPVGGGGTARAAGEGAGGVPPGALGRDDGV